MRVELDKKSLFALASDTRLDILRSLQPMRRTVSQLAEALQYLIDEKNVFNNVVLGFQQLGAFGMSPGFFKRPARAEHPLAILRRTPPPARSELLSR